MRLSPVRLGFALAATAYLAYLPAAEFGPWIVLGLASGAGLAVAAAGARRGPHVTWGLRIAALATTLSTLLSIRRGFEIWTIPEVVLTVGILMAAWAAGSRGHDFGVRAGAATTAFGTSLWILVDPFNFSLTSPWLPGNVLGIVGWSLVAARFEHASRAAEETIAPPAPET